MESNIRNTMYLNQQKIQKIYLLFKLHYMYIMS